VVEIVDAFACGHGVEEAADGGPELVPGPGRGFAEQRLELGEEGDGPDYYSTEGGVLQQVEQRREASDTAPTAIA
jgi:hypothetical protein